MGLVTLGVPVNRDSAASLACCPPRSESEIPAGHRPATPPLALHVAAWEPQNLAGLQGRPGSSGRGPRVCQPGASSQARGRGTQGGGFREGEMLPPESLFVDSRPRACFCSPSARGWVSDALRQARCLEGLRTGLGWPVRGESTHIPPRPPLGASLSAARHGHGHARPAFARTRALAATRSDSAQNARSDTKATAFCRCNRQVTHVTQPPQAGPPQGTGARRS